MLQRMIGPILTGAGVLILAASLLANVIGQFPIGETLGLGRDPGFGPQQTTGTIVGVVVLIGGVWLWRRGAESKFGSVRYVIALLAFAVVIGGPIYAVANRGLRQYAAVVACVEVETVPSSAEGAGQKLVNYGVRITSTGESRVYVDSVVLIAFRDSAGSWLPQSEVVAMEDFVLWTQVDSVTRRPATPGLWALSTGNQIRHMRPVIVPVDQLSPLYRFRGIVFFRHRDPGQPIVRNSVMDWIDSFPQECP